MLQDKRTENIVDGARLNMALKSESGQVFVEEVIRLLTINIEFILKESTRDNEALAVVNESRGVIRLLSGIGDKVAWAKGLAAKKLANQALRRKDAEEE